MKRVFLVAALAVATGAFVTVAFADSDASSLPPTWHVHDCLPGAACTWPHAGTAFFPSILGYRTAAEYVASGDPARCPDATDKALLGGGQPGSPGTGGVEPNQPLRAGVCMTSTKIIHLRTVPVGTSGPSGWSSIASGGFVTYYLVTSR